MDAFRPFTLTHGLVLAGIAALTWLAISHGRAQHDDAAPTTFEKRLAVLNLLAWLAAHGWWQLPPRFDAAFTLPLQMCHLASLVASFALLTRRRALRTVLYFWGFGLCTQALLTPGISDPPSSIWFWAFWFLHGFVMMAAIYDLAVLRYHPAWRDFGVACASSAAYFVIALAVNIQIGSNYGFVGDSKPGTPSIVDLLGPWPQRLLLIVPLAAAVLALLMAPWVLLRRASRLSPP